MRAADIIRKKRDGEELTSVEIDHFVRSAASRARGQAADWAEYQLSAMLMAIVLKGMTSSETARLTRSMTDSGRRYSWADIPGPKLDKHSTGGVGDTTSLILAPLVAACGGIVPMMSGRGLGHTGGTLDKLESIPGFRVNLNEDEFRRSLQVIGMGMIGQTADVAPADKLLYSLRDVTSTVESVPLITASILSKKLAEGIDALVMDVKCGVGAFMKNFNDAKTLAESIVSVGRDNGVKTVALITGMDIPLGRSIGNSLEVIESIEILKGNRPGHLEDLSVKLGAGMLVMGGLATTIEQAEANLRQAISSGRGLERFRLMVTQQGGNARVVDNTSLLPQSPKTHLVRATRKGFLMRLHAEKIGLGACLLGAGRQRAEDNVLHDVGAIVQAGVGEEVREGDPILEIHYRDETSLSPALAYFETAIAISDEPPTTPSLVFDQIGAWT